MNELIESRCHQVGIARFRTIVGFVFLALAGSFPPTAFAEEGDYAGVGGARNGFFTGSDNGNPATDVMQICPEIFAT